MSDQNHLRFSDTQPEYLTPDSENLGIWNIWYFADDFEGFQGRNHSGTPDVQVLRVREFDPSLWPHGSFLGTVTGERRGNSHAIQHSLFYLSEFLRLTQ